MLVLVNGQAREVPDGVRIDPRRLGEVAYIRYEECGLEVEVTFVAKLQNAGMGDYVFYDQNNALHRIEPDTCILEVRYMR